MKLAPMMHASLTALALFAIAAGPSRAESPEPLPALILAQAKIEDADYIVMGSHGHTALYDLLVGSTTHGVLMRAGCPVVITPGPKAVVKGAGK